MGRLSIGARDRALRKQLADAGARYLGGDMAALDPAWFDLAFDAHLERGGLVAAKQLADKALASQDATFRPVALAALGSSGDPEIARWLLEDLREPRLRSSEQRILLGGVMRARTTREFGYRWLTDNLDRLLASNDGIFFTSRLPQLLGGFCSIERAREFARELRPRFAGKPGELELARVIERVRNCGVLHDTMVEAVSAEIAEMR